MNRKYDKTAAEKRAGAVAPATPLARSTELKKDNMKINVSKLTNLTPVDRDTVRGFAAPANSSISKEVIVRRTMKDGWKVNIEIVVDGIIYHSDTATESDKDAFNGLMAAAWTAENARHEAKRKAACELANEIFDVFA